MIALLAFLAVAAAHNGTCPASKKCGAGSSEEGLPCCQITSSSFECCSSSEACIPKVGCRCQAGAYEDYSFQQFCSEFSKAYGGGEAAQRQGIFEANLEKIRAHNAEYKLGLHSWYMAVNQFADWSEEEFSAIRATEHQPSFQTFSTLELDSTKPKPESMDWRSKGVVTAVKDQGCLAADGKIQRERERESKISASLRAFVSAACFELRWNWFHPFMFIGH